MRYHRPAPQTSRLPLSPSRPRASAAERGSAFVVALLVLLVLTISGLAVTLMTQTELRIGSNERTANRSLYASDSGIQVATARKSYLGAEPVTHTFQINTTLEDTGGTANTTFSDQVTITPLIPLSTQYCNLCQVNKGMSQAYTQIVFGVNSTAVRTGVNGAFNQALASKILGATIKMQPQPNGDAVNPIAVQIPLQQ
jgi:Tfp pilus assembly protein PilX